MDLTRLLDAVHALLTEVRALHRLLAEVRAEQHLLAGRIDVLMAAVREMERDQARSASETENPWH